MTKKEFEVGDVLPASIIEIRANYDPNDYGGVIFKGYNVSHIIYEGSGTWDVVGFADGYTQINDYIIRMDFSNYSLQDRTVTAYWGDDTRYYWEEIPQGYSITFEENGGTNVTDLTEQAALPNPLPTTTKSGYTFVAWYYESNFQTRAKAGDTIEANTTLYAKWHTLGSLFTEIADAIRSKDGTSENIRDVDFGERVKQIQPVVELTQAQYDALSVYDNNTYYLIVEEE